MSSILFPMHKCYFSQIDENFDPNKDIVLGSWCFRQVEEMRNYDAPEPYNQEEQISLHRKLYDLSFYLLNRDCAKNGWGEQEVLLLQSKYLFFVYFSFPLFRLLRKILSNQENLYYEKVYPLKKPFSYEDYFSPKGMAYIAFKMLNSLNLNAPPNFFEHSHSKTDESVFNDEAMPHLSLLERFKRKINFFYELTGITTVQGSILTLLYLLRNFRNKNIISKFYYNPQPHFSQEIEDYIKVFDKISFEFLSHNGRLIKKEGKLLIKHPRFIYLSESDYFSILNSEMKGESKIFIFQHGSYYATVETHFTREIEYNLSTFISYGSETESYLNLKNVIKTLPSPYLSTIRNAYKFDSQKTFLWITGFHNKVGDGLQYPYSKGIVLYQNNKKKFYNLLELYTKEKLYYKPWPITENQFDDEIQEIIPRAKIIKSENIIPLMLNAKIIFIDYYSTALYEAMSMNLPIVCSFFDSPLNFTEKAQKLFKKFKDVGIFYETPEQVAEFFNNFSNIDIEKWWMSKEIQSVRQEFLDKYANNKPWLWPWTKAILKKEI